MPLRLTLKKNERVMLGRAVVINGSKGIILIIENKVPILREKDILLEKDAHTPYEKMYYTLQLMYLDEPNRHQYLASLAELANYISLAVPSAASIMEEINTRIEEEDYYRALKTARYLIEYVEAHQNTSV